MAISLKNMKIRDKVEFYREKLSSPEARAEIERILLSRSKDKDRFKSIPKIGIIAGQAVASAIVEYLGLESEITPVYNDLDVFITDSLDYSHAISATSGESCLNVGKHVLSTIFSIKPDKEESALSPKNSIALAGLNIGNEYQAITSGLFFGYNVRSIKNHDDINTIFLEVNMFLKDAAPSQYTISMDEDPSFFQRSKVEHFISYFLQSFDINTTKAGFMIGHKESSLVVDEHFLLFLATKQIEIDKMPNPVTAYLRALKKREELGVYFDDKKYRPIVEGQVDIMQSIYNSLPPSGIEEDIYSAGSVFLHKDLIRASFTLSDKYKKLFKKYQKEYLPALKANWDDNKKGAYPFDVRETRHSGMNLIKSVDRSGVGILLGESPNSEKHSELMTHIEKLYSGDVMDVLKQPGFSSYYKELKHISAAKEQVRNYTNDRYENFKDFFSILEDSHYKYKAKALATPLLFSLPEIASKFPLLGKARIKAIANAIYKLNHPYEYIMDNGKKVSESRVSESSELVKEYYSKEFEIEHPNPFPAFYNDMSMDILQESPLAFVDRILKYNNSPNEIERYIQNAILFKGTGHISFYKKILKVEGNIAVIGEVFNILLGYKDKFVSDIFIGVCESDPARFFSFGGYKRLLDERDVFIEELANEEISKQKGELISLPKEKKHIETPSYIIDILNNRFDLQKEGRELNHCVGGYGNAIESGRSIIAALNKKGQDKTRQYRITVELQGINRNGPIEKKGTYSIKQARGFNNKTMEMTDEVALAMIALNKQFPFYNESVKSVDDFLAKMSSYFIVNVKDKKRLGKELCVPIEVGAIESRLSCEKEENEELGYINDLEMWYNTLT